MKLQTFVDILPFDRQIDYRDELFAIGSCFAQRISEAMERAKFRVVSNPTGTLFNPQSIVATIERLVDGRLVEAAELHEGGEGWYHYDMHSSLNGATRAEALERINGAVVRGHEALDSSSWVVVTLGTAWVYEHCDEGRVVANCHKQPARLFRRRRMSVEEVCRALERIVELLPNKRIVFTLSPIRHLADGACDNSVSKATLRLAIDEVVGRFANLHYFPAYEIVLDELRDYRFYDRDMTHPSSVAVEYIWERFCQTAISPEASATMQRVMQVVRAAEHRPYNPHSEAHSRFCAAQLAAIRGLEGVDFSEECRYFEQFLRNNL